MRVSVTVQASGTDIAAELDAAQRNVRAVPASLASTVGDAAAEAVLSSVQSERGTLSVSGLGATLDVTRLTSGGESAGVTLAGVPRGAWSLVDRGASPHTQRRRRGMPTDYGVYSRVRHPGFAGGDYWASATDALAGNLDQTVVEAFQSAVI